MRIKDVKIMGTVGVILNLLGFLPRVGFLIRLVGIIMIIIAVNGLSKAMNDEGIFNKYLIGFIISIVGSTGVVILAFILGAGAFLTSIFSLSPYNFFQNITSTIIFIILLFYAVLIASAYFYRESFKLAAGSTKVKQFSTAGDLIFYGSILIILVVGAFLIFAGWIFLAAAFLSLPDEIESQPLDPSSS
jgi:uncharacterized membrane protein